MRSLRTFRQTGLVSGGGAENEVGQDLVRTQISIHYFQCFLFIRIPTLKPQNAITSTKINTSNNSETGNEKRCAETDNENRNNTNFNPG